MNKQNFYDLNFDQFKNFLIEKAEIDNKKAIHNSPGDISSNKSRFGPMLIGSNADIIRKKAIAITKVDFFSR